MNKKYLLSVRLMTFNHAEFIAQAMEGILNQQTNFKVEVIVGDDFSSDDTLEIIKKYNDTENIHIKILERKIGDEYWKRRKELGRLYNFKNILENCTGKYIALLDGDDYWTDTLKLQKQVNYLEKNSDYELVAHKHNKLVNNELIINRNIYKEDLTTFDLASNINFATLSVVFRRENISKYVDKYVVTIPFTYFLFYYVSQFGKVRLINENMGVYRVHDGGVWSGIDFEKKYLMSSSVLIETIDFFEDIDIKNKLIEKFTNSTLHLVKDYKKQHNYRKVITYTKRSFKYGVNKGHFKFLIGQFKIIIKNIIGYGAKLL